MAEQYLGAARARGWDGARRLVDKSLTNHAHVGLIHLMFPKAIILHTVRSAPDTCFSCYRTLFGNDALMAFAYDLETIAARYRIYREVMAHWSFVLMGRVTEVRHERLVADPESHIRSLLATCGLVWDPQCLRFCETERVIDTASAEQVRRPIFGDGVGRWRTYERQLAPLVRALGPYGRST